ncbi:MAG: CPBP family intramembrane glutamic endopeptidase [Bacilli bacterium]|jgi:membrane protease YdiL (CAAX protease family)
MASQKVKYNLIYIILLFLVVISIPLDYFFENQSLELFIHGLFRISFSIYLLYFIKKENVFIIRNNKLSKKDLLLLPFAFTISNNLLLIMFVDDIQVTLTAKILLTKIVFYFGVALIEEIVFRGCLVDYLNRLLNKSKLKAIIYSSLSFGLIHSINIFEIGLTPTIFQISYTFLTGLLFAFIYLYANNLTICIILHFFYNLINETIFTGIVETNWNIPMYLFTTLNILLTFFYALFLYRKRLIEK